MKAGRVSVAVPMRRSLAGMSESKGILRHSPWDALLVAGAALHGALLVLAPSIPLIAIGLWWNANTISHNFIHLPFFQSRAANKLFSAWLSLLLGFPQSFWRDRHLAHHNETSLRHARFKPSWLGEGLLVLALWLMLLVLAPKFFLTVYLPGWTIGLGLCQLQGYFEHARGTVSHYGRLYNFLFFNDGYHAEHHARPGRHWTQLPRWEIDQTQKDTSRWPAALRWLEYVSLDGLEELVLRSARLQSFVLRAHERAFARLLSRMAPVRRVVIIGGGLFPRTALVVRRLAPDALITIIDAHAENLERAKSFLDSRVEMVRGYYEPASAERLVGEADLLVVPLAFRGSKAALYRHPPTRNVVVHDWLWRRHGNGTAVSFVLLKRLNWLHR
jgi:hypothetical protein